MPNLKLTSARTIVDLHPYHQTLYISMGESEERFAQGITLVYPPEYGEEVIQALDMSDMTTNGLSLCLPCGSFLRLRKFPDTPADYGMLQHEIFHAVELLFKEVRMPHHPDYSSEAWAYLIESLTTQIYTFMRDV